HGADGRAEFHSSDPHRRSRLCDRARQDRLRRRLGGSAQQQRPYQEVLSRAVNKAASTRRRTNAATRLARRSVLGLLCAVPIRGAATALMAGGTTNGRLISPAKAAQAALSKAQGDALEAYNNTVAQFRAVLNERRAQIEAKLPLPNLPGQALYLARIAMMSA